jgi:putative transposon-encoded protein
MTILSTGTLSLSPTYNSRLYTPFIIYGRILQTSSITMSGNRWERIRDIEKIANLIEITIQNDGSILNDNIEVSYPIKFTQAFGNEPARVTINGNYLGSREEVSGEYKPPKKIAEDVERINTGVIETGQGSFNSADLEPSDTTNDIVTEIKNYFDTLLASYIEIMAMDVFGIMYGRRGRHFPE